MTKLEQMANVFFMERYRSTQPRQEMEWNEYGHKMFQGGFMAAVEMLESEPAISMMDKFYKDWAKWLKEQVK